MQNSIMKPTSLVLILLGALGASGALTACAIEEIDSEEHELEQRGCQIEVEKSMLIRDPLVVDDVRARGVGTLSFSRLLMEMLPGISENAAAATFGPTSSVCSSNTAAICQRLAEPPRLVAVVNRLDLITADNPVGELRFIYQRFDDIAPSTAQRSSADPLLGKFINFEFDLSRVRDAQNRPIDRRSWAKMFHKLDRLRLGSPSYFTELEAIVSLVTRRNAAPGGQNGSAIRAVRTSTEGWYPGRDRWELLSFEIAGADHPAVIRGLAQVGQLMPGLLEHTPQKSGIRGETANWRYIPPGRQDLAFRIAD
jgi:hypothetical protein